MARSTARPEAGRPATAVRLLAGLLCGLLAAPPVTGASLLLTEIRRIDPETATVGPPEQILIRHGFIRAVLPADQPPPPADRVIDGRGAFLIPGLAEMHGHLDSAFAGFSPETVLALNLAHGVTTLRNMRGTAQHADLKIRLATGELPGPRLITTGPTFSGQTVGTPEQAADRVRAQAEAGYDFIKLHPGLRPGVFDTVMATARRLNRPVAGHVPQSVELSYALASGMASIEHLEGYLEKLLPPDPIFSAADTGLFGSRVAAHSLPGGIHALAAATAAGGAASVPTLALGEVLLGERPPAELARRPEMAYVTVEEAERWQATATRFRDEHDDDARRAYIELRRALTAAIHAAGGTILAGGDAPHIMNVPGAALHHELALLVAAGLTPAEALGAATVQAARFLGQDAYGCLDAGCVADLVVLDSDPLADIAAIRQIRGVVRAGRWHEPATLLAPLRRRAVPLEPTDTEEAMP